MAKPNTPPGQEKKKPICKTLIRVDTNPVENK